MFDKRKVTILYLSQEKESENCTSWHVELIGDKPTEPMAKRGITELLKYAGKIYDII